MESQFNDRNRRQVRNVSQVRRSFATILDQAGFGVETIIRRPNKPDVLLMRLPEAKSASRCLGIDDMNTLFQCDLDEVARGVSGDFSEYI